VTRASTAIGVSPIIKDIVQKKALATRLTLKEIIYVGMLAIEELDEKRLQELADQVHLMQVNGEIWGVEGDRAYSDFKSFLEGLTTWNHLDNI
jgi:hypothetical protein